MLADRREVGLYNIGSTFPRRHLVVQTEHGVVYTSISDYEESCIFGRGPATWNILSTISFCFVFSQTKHNYQRIHLAKHRVSENRRFCRTLEDYHRCDEVVVNVLISSCASEEITPKRMRERATEAICLQRGEG